MWIVEAILLAIQGPVLVLIWRMDPQTERERERDDFCRTIIEAIRQRSTRREERRYR